MDITWEKYVCKKQRNYQRRTSPKVRINNHGCVYFSGCNLLVPDFYSRDTVEILLGKNEDGSICKIGFNFMAERSENSEDFIHTKYAHYFASRPFVNQYFPGIVSNSSISSISFEVSIESDSFLSISLENYTNK